MREAGRFRLVVFPRQYSERAVPSIGAEHKNFGILKLASMEIGLAVNSSAVFQVNLNQLCRWEKSANDEVFVMTTSDSVPSSKVRESLTKTWISQPLLGGAVT